MENKNAIAATIGIGAIGSILAYYGYNKLSNPISEDTNNDSFVNAGEGIGTTSDMKRNTEVDIKDHIKDQIKDQIKKEVEKMVQDVSPKKTKGDEWKNFWAAEYHENVKKTTLLEQE